MLRMWARQVGNVCARTNEPVPPGARAILVNFTPDRQVADTEAFRYWCARNGLEFMCMNFAGTLNAFVPPDDGAPTYRRQ